LGILILLPKIDVSSRNMNDKLRKTKDMHKCTIMHKFFLEDHRLSFHAKLMSFTWGCSIIFDKGSGSGVCGSIDPSLQCPEN